MDLPTELREKLMMLKDALNTCFGNFHETDDGWITVECCGPITYGSGIMGSDIVRCKKCGKSIINILSPHVSPLLIRGHVTSIPNGEMLNTIGDQCWIIVEKETSQLLTDKSVSMC